jgi:diguanylate cyclase (GGDEF)-like protein/PAS domain S-box-containing protein
MWPSRMTHRDGMLQRGLIGLAMLLLAWPALADRSFQRLGVDDGLDTPAVYGVVQDARGFIWAGGSSAGVLHRFDGTKFDRFPLLHDADGPSQDSGTLLIDRDDRVWAATWGGGLFVLGVDRQPLRRYQFSANDPDSLPSDRVQALHQDRDGIIWAGTTAGLARIAVDGGLSRLPLGNEGASQPRVWAIASAPGRLWVGTTDGLFEVADDGTQLLHRPAGANDDDARGSEIRSLALLPDGSLWAGTRSGLQAFDAASGRFVAVADAPAELQVNTLLFDGDSGHLLLGTQAGIYRYALEAGHFVHADRGATRFNSLGGSDIRSLLIDRSSVLWAGSRYGGLFRGAPPAQFGSLRDLLSGEARSADIGADTAITAVHVDPADMLWLGAADGLAGVSLRDGTLTNVRAADGTQLPGVVTGLTTIGESLWIATERGLFRRRAGEAQAVAVDAPFRALGISAPSLRALSADRNGALLIGLWGRGALRWKPDSERSPEWLLDGLGPTPGEAVFAIAESPDGSVWIGTRYGGLHRVDPDGGHAAYTVASDLGLPGDAIACLRFAVDGSLLVCTDRGLARRAPDAARFEPVAAADGLPSGLVAAAAEDAGGSLWVATKGGLARLQGEGQPPVVFRRSDGLPGSEFNRGAFASDRNGRMYAGTAGGLTWFDPMRVTYNTTPPHVAFTHIDIDGSEVDPSLATDPSAPLELPRDSRRFTVEFAALDFRDSSANQHRYRLVGLDDDWRQASSLRQATYTSLPPGDYRLEVAGSNSHGLWGEPAVLHVRATAAWWKLPAGQIGIVWALILLFGVVPLARNAQLRRRAAELEQTVTRRTAELLERRLSLEEAQRRARMGSFDWTFADDRVIWSAGLYRILGADPDTFTPSLDSFLAAVHPDDREAVGRRVRDAATNCTPYQGEFRLIRADGVLRRVHASGDVSRDASGKPIGMSGALQDVTEQSDTLAALRNSEERFRSAFESSAIGIALLSPEGHWLKVNPTMCRIVGYSERELLTMHFSQITLADDLAGDTALQRRVLTGELPNYSREKRYRRRDGTHVWVNLTVSLVRDEAGAPLYFVSQIQDIDERKRVESALQDTLARLNEAQRIGRSGDWAFDPGSGALTWSPSLYVLFERDPARGRPTWHDHLACFDEDSRVLLKQRVATLLADGVPQEYELRAVLPSGRSMIVHTRALATRDERGQVVRVQGVLQDVTERKRIDAELRSAAETDFLTGAYNRRFLFDAATRELARCRRDGIPFSAIAMDIDHFKRINDSHGHDAGDRVLVALARRMRDGIRGSDVFARLGGEEFVMILPGTPLATAVQVAEKFRGFAGEIEVAHEPEPIRITVSFGVATDEDGSLDALLKRADAALYDAKQQGRNRVCVRRAGDVEPAAATTE